MPINWDTFDIFAGASGPGFYEPAVLGASGGITGSVSGAKPETLKIPPPAGYPRIIVHPERPNAAFALIGDGWYRSPTGDVVSYKTVADYVLTAKGTARSVLLKSLGQTPSEGWGPSTLLLAGGALLLLVIVVKK